jgi:hypothetical protein
MYDRCQQLNGIFVNAVERLVELAFEHGQYLRCVALCQQALDAAPASDDIVCWLLHSYHRLGRIAEFEHAYRRYLRVAAVDPVSAEGSRDAVVKTYGAMLNERVVGR